MIWYIISERKANMKAIAIDIGATSGRVMVVAYQDGRLEYKQYHRFLNRIYEKDSTLYWDFTSLIKNIDEGISLALKDNDDIKSIGIDTWAVDYGFIDKNGNLLHDPKCYRDTHSIASHDELVSKISFEKIYLKTGIQDLHFNTIYQLYNDEDKKRDGVTFLMIPDLIAYHLTGEKRLELTNVSTTSLLNQKTLDFDDELLKDIDVDKKIFPSILKPGELYGHYLNKIPVYATCTHDTASAVLGTDGEGDFAYLSSGTWSLIGTELTSPFINEISLKSNFTNEIGYDKTIRFLKNTMGMFVINETILDYERLTNKKIEMSSIKDLVENSNECHQYIDTNDVSFETPKMMIEKINKYLSKTGQEEIHDIGLLLKCIYQSMAMSYRENIEVLNSILEKRLDELIIVGGGNQADILNQYTSSACDIKVKTGPIEATVLGNSLAQFIALGAIKDKEEGRKIISNSIKEKIFTPIDVEKWNLKYIEYQRVIKGGKQHG